MPRAVIRSIGLHTPRRGALRVALVLGAVVVFGSGCSEPSAVTAHDEMHSSSGPSHVQNLSADDLHLLAQVRAATARYHDVDVAVADGYVAEPMCVSIAAGGMGVHYANPELVGFVEGSQPRTGTDPNIDPLRPEVLVYEPQENGRMRLVAVEYMVFQAAWLQSNAGPPTLFGAVFPLRMHGWQPHYELHLWLWRENPNGLTAEWNPKVECP